MLDDITGQLGVLLVAYRCNNSFNLLKIGGWRTPNTWINLSTLDIDSHCSMVLQN